MSYKRSGIGFLRTLFLILVSVSFLVSCGGGGGSDPAPTPVTQSANGIWAGTLVENGVGTYTVDCLLYEGDIIAINSDAGVIYKGTYTVSGNNFSANVDAMQIGGGLFDTGTMSGTVIEQDRLTASFNSASGSTGSISVTFDQIYNRPSSFSLVEGTWSKTSGTYTGNLTITDAGGVSGSDSDGCQVTGVVSILDPNHNLYGLDVDVTSCGELNGSYDGFSGLSDENQENDTLTYTVSNGNYILIYSLTRQF